MNTDAATLNNIVVANHILANEEVVDAFGHISFRHPEDPEISFVACSGARIDRSGRHRYSGLTAKPSTRATADPTASG